jgi:hypothetical protein
MVGAPNLGLGFWIDDVEGVGTQEGEMNGQGGRTSHERGPQQMTRLIRVAKERGGVSFMREGTSLEEGRHIGKRKGRGVYQKVTWELRKGAPHLWGAHTRV